MVCFVSLSSTFLLALKYGANSLSTRHVPKSRLLKKRLDFKKGEIGR